FFFFQAEDGIRDFHVTGVQTCALPISSWRRWNKKTDYLFSSWRIPMPQIASPVLVDTVTHWARECDVLVVGAGVAGVCAALEAHRAGANVLVVERASGGGGASGTSEGIFYLGGGTDVQTACGYQDSPEAMSRCMRASTSTGDDDKVRFYCDNSVEHCRWMEAQGVPFERRVFEGKAVAVYTG